MTLLAKYIATEFPDSTQISVVEKTGTYNPTTNPGGYNTPNPSVSDIVSCTAEITKPDATTLKPSTDPAMKITKNVHSGTGSVLPNTSDTPQYITATELGYDGGKLSNGIYKIRIYQEKDGAAPGDDPIIVSDVTLYLLVMNSVNCCIEKMMINANIEDCCDCKEKSVASNIRDGKNFLWGAIDAIKHGFIDKSALFLKRAIEICSGCKKCNC